MKAKYNRICFVCTGNTCRSPMAEKLLKAELVSKKYFSLDICSAGLCVKTDDFVNNMVSSTLKPLGIKMGKRKAKQLKNKDIVSTTLFITMTADQKKAFIGYDNIFSYGEIVGYGDVEDPFEKGELAYRQTLDKLLIYTKILAEKIINGNI